jgi:hypothetical protein
LFLWSRYQYCTIARRAKSSEPPIMLDIIALAPAIAKLIDLGIEGWQAATKDGWGAEEAKAF